MIKVKLTLQANKDIEGTFYKTGDKKQVKKI